MNHAYAEAVGFGHVAPAAESAAAAARIWPLRTPIDCARLRVKRMSAYEQPSRFASPSAAADHSRYFGSRTGGGAWLALGSNVRANAHAAPGRDRAGAEGAEENPRLVGLFTTCPPVDSTNRIRRSRGSRNLCGYHRR